MNAHSQSPHRTLWSATTIAPYPKDPDPFYHLGGQHLIEPVPLELIERLYSEGVRVFVQMGVGSLSSFVSDTLRGRPHRVIDAHSERLSAWSQWLKLAGSFCRGSPISFRRLRVPGLASDLSIPLKLSPSSMKFSTTRQVVHEMLALSLVKQLPFKTDLLHPLLKKVIKLSGP